MTDLVPICLTSAAGFSAFTLGCPTYARLVPSGAEVGNGSGPMVIDGIGAGMLMFADTGAGRLTVSGLKRTWKLAVSLPMAMLMAADARAPGPALVQDLPGFDKVGHG